MLSNCCRYYRTAIKMNLERIVKICVKTCVTVGQEQNRESIVDRCRTSDVRGVVKVDNEEKRRGEGRK